MKSTWTVRARPFLCRYGPGPWRRNRVPPNLILFYGVMRIFGYRVTNVCGGLFSLMPPVRALLVFAWERIQPTSTRRDLVPKKGLEPPHPCGYMDLNHARLPIPPLRPWAGAPGGKIGATPNIYLLTLHNFVSNRAAYDLVRFALNSNRPKYKEEFPHKFRLRVTILRASTI